MSVAIIGAGWAGLACALELAAAGRPVTLFESAPQAGGRARGVDWNGLRIDNGQHLLIGAYYQTLRLLERIGTSARLRRLPLRLHTPPDFLLAAPNLPAPLHVALALGRATGLSWGDKARAARMMLRLRASAYRLPADTNVAEFLQQHGQRQKVVDLLWEPLCLAALNTPLQQASARVFCTVLRDSLGGARSASEFLFADGSLDELFVKPALAWLRARNVELCLGQRIHRIQPLASGFDLDGRAYAQVVCAVHPAQAPTLLPEVAELDHLRRQLAALRWEPICTLWLRFPSAPQLAFPMLGLRDGPGQWLFDRSDLCPGLVSVVISASGAHLDWDSRTLTDRVTRQLRRVLPDLPDPIDAKRITEKRATFACHPNLLRPGNATPLPGLYLAGDYTTRGDAAAEYPATLESAVRSGVQCAHLINPA